MSKKDDLLIIDDEAEIIRQLKWALADEYQIHTAEDAPAALKVLKQIKPAVITLDLGLPPKPETHEIGMELLAEILKSNQSAKIIVITGNDERENAIQAIGRGAWDFYQKPIDLTELKVILKRAFYVSTLEREKLELQQGLENRGRLDEMIGNSPEMNKIFTIIRKVANADVSVLVTGESGTGKELIARSIHLQSDRRDKPFIAINCGAIPENLLEAEFFGHEKGSYTGAHTQRKGKVEYANEGTLFLDEISELPALLQVKILRFLQERVIERIGGRNPIELDVRIVAATQKDLKKAIVEGEFREDLYYRLSVVNIEVPPLRARGSDVVLLGNYFLRKSCQEMQRSPAKFNPGAIRAIEDYKWPGNVRELENRVKRAVVMGEDQFIKSEDLDFAPDNLGADETISLKEARENLERDCISRALVNNDWHIVNTAKQIGVTRPTLYDLIKKYSLRKEDYVAQ